MTIPRHIHRTTVALIAMLAWWFGWQYHRLWTSTFRYLDAHVWQPYRWLWEPLIIVAIIGVFAFLIIIAIKFHYDIKKWAKEQKEGEAK